MIIKGKSRTGPDVLGPYLLSTEKNERAQIIEIKGTLSRDIVGALTEMDAYAEGTKCEHPLYHAQINPEPPYRLTLEQCFECVDALEEKLGLEGHARVVVLHEKHGRQHIHVVWTRIDLDHMRAVPDSHNFVKHEQVARDLERRFGHPHVQGAHAERDGERPDRSLTPAEVKQQARTGIKVKDVKREVTEAFRASEGPEEFVKALDEKGYIVAKGDRRDYVIVDREGGYHGLTKRIEGMRAARLRDFMAPLDRESFPTVEEAQNEQFDRQHGLPSAQAFENWQDKLAEAAIQQEIEHEMASAPNKQLQNETDAYLTSVWSSMLSWEDAIMASGIAKAIQEEQERQALIQAKLEARHDALMVLGYGRSETYVAQTTAAQRDYTERQSALNIDPRPQYPNEYMLDISGQFLSAGLWAGSAMSLSATHHVEGDEHPLDFAIGAVTTGMDFNALARNAYDRARLFPFAESAIEAEKRMLDARVERLWPEFPQALAFEIMSASERPVSEINELVDYKALADSRYVWMRQFVGNEFDDAATEEAEKEKNRKDNIAKREADDLQTAQQNEVTKPKRSLDCLGGLDLTEEQQAQMDRLLVASHDLESSRDGPDTQHEASGEGRSRSP